MEDFWIYPWLTFTLVPFVIVDRRGDFSQIFRNPLARKERASPVIGIASKLMSRNVAEIPNTAFSRAHVIANELFHRFRNYHFSSLDLKVTLGCVYLIRYRDDEAKWPVENRGRRREDSTRIFRQVFFRSSFLGAENVYEIVGVYIENRWTRFQNS